MPNNELRLPETHNHPLLLNCNLNWDINALTIWSNINQAPHDFIFMDPHQNKTHQNSSDV